MRIFLETACKQALTFLYPILYSYRRITRPYLVKDFRYDAEEFYSTRPGQLPPVKFIYSGNWEKALGLCPVTLAEFMKTATTKYEIPTTIMIGFRKVIATTLKKWKKN